MHALLPLLFSLAAALPAEDRKYDPDAHAKAIAPFIEARTFAVVHLDLTQLDAEALAERFAALKAPAEQTAAVRATLSRVHDLTKVGARDAYLIFSLADLPERPPFLVFPVRGEASKALAGQLRKFDGIPRELGVADFEGALVLAEAQTVKRLRELRPEPQPRPEFAKAFAVAGPGFFHAVAVPTTDLPRIAEELLPTLPPELGGGSIKVLTRGVKAVVLAIEPPPKMRLRLVVQAADKEAAKALHELFQRVVALAAKSEVGRGRPGIDKLLEALSPTLEGDRLMLSMDEEQFVKTFAEPVQRLREAAARVQSMNNMKQIGLAMHNHLDVFKRFPTPAIYGKGDKPLLSWRVQLLPFLDENELYKQFHLDEPWDSEHNKKLIAKMPRVYESTADNKLAKEGKTTYLVPLGKETMFPGGKGVRIQDVTDGTSNTIMLVDAADDKAVIWTKPDDLEIDPKDPHKGLALRASDNYLALFADGSVRGLPKKIDKNTLWALFTMAGGEVVNIP